MSYLIGSKIKTILIFENINYILIFKKIYIAALGRLLKNPKAIESQYNDAKTKHFSDLKKKMNQMHL